ncbi:MAG: UvrD-helicase domain-containing protein, partial [candidate division Zixibacteria bacterium]|nr:UvrD-helicase domain-containing protein [candidate division Zixibacteria bacterium]
MSWDRGLLPAQKKAAEHTGSHARLLAGPGTGKTLTLTRRICYLIQNKKQNPSEIFALTFTRAAAHELLKRVKNEVGEDNVPRISTLHSFSLRQLLLNAKKLTSLPQPLRIAD